MRSSQTDTNVVVRIANDVVDVDVTETVVAGVVGVTATEASETDNSKDALPPNRPFGNSNVYS